MAEGDAIVTNIFKKLLLDGDVDCDNDSFKVALFSVALASPDGSPAYTTTNEIVASGYTAGGAAVSGPTTSQDDANDRAKWDDDGSNITWTNLATATIVEARLYDDTHASDYVCILWEIATNSNGANYSLNFHSDGILLLS